MVATEQPLCAFGWKAPDFSLADADGRMFQRDDVKGGRGLLVMFICNHCPFVRAIADRLGEDARVLQSLGIGVVGIMPNDYKSYPDDAPPMMKRFAEQHRFGFPYLVDQTQEVARAYGAVCTPDFFGFNADLALQYRGRLDASGRNPSPAGAPRELVEAMRRVAETGQGPERQTASIGCSIKWRGEG